MPRPRCTFLRIVVWLPASSGVVDEAVSSRANDTNDGPRTQLYSTTRPSWAPVSAWNTAASNRGPRKSCPMTCVEINQCVGCTDNSSLSHFSAMTRPSWLG